MRPVFFPPFRLDPRSERIYRGQTAVPLRPKTYAVLRHLVAHAGQLVTKEQLLDAVWPETAISDGVLKVSVREIREALGDDSRTPRFIETAHRVGYRFIAEVTASTVPAYLTSFVGRERAVADLERLLSVTRFLTLTGVGGSGKTRLAARLAERVAGFFSDGVWWVDLTALSDPGSVVQAVNSCLGVHEHPTRTAAETLIHHLRHKELLLVLDNCEHLVGECAELADSMLRACSALKVLATSREGLRVTGETLWLVPPLALPEPGAPHRLEDLTSCEAVRLFIDRARSAKPEFAPEAGSAAALAQVCSRLDGLPLAIELAAPRLKVLTLEELAARLDRGFRLLMTGGRTDLPRHQTLRATIDWSYDLLPEKERTLLLRLSVFAGGWSLDAAEDICAGNGLDATEIFDLLVKLVDKSLVVALVHSGETRYGLLETVRQYAWDKLEEREERRAVKSCHLEHFLRFAEGLAPHINTPRRGAVLARLAADQDNLREALRFAADTGDTAAELTLVHALTFFWFLRGEWREGRTWMKGALERSAAEGRTTARGRVLADQGMLATLMGDPAAIAALEESVSIHREQGDALDLAHALRFMVFGGDPPDRSRVCALARESVAIYRSHNGSPFDLAGALSNLGSALFAAGEYDAARSAYEESVALCRASRELWFLSAPLTKLGVVLFRQGDLEAAMGSLKESVALQRDVGERWFLSLALEGLARVLIAQGNCERGARLLGVGESLREAIGASLLHFYLNDQEEAVNTLRDAVGRQRLVSWWSEGRAMTMEQAIAYALADVGVTAHDETTPLAAT